MTARRLLLFGINFAPEPTGVGVVTGWLAQALGESGFDLAVVTGYPHVPWWRRQPDPPPPAAGAPYRLVRCRHRIPRTQSALRRGAYELSWVLAALPALARADRPDLAIGVVPSLGGAVLAAAAAVRFRVPYALIVQDLVGRAAEQSGVRGGVRVAGLVARVERMLARRAAAVAIIAESFRGYFAEGGVDPGRLARVRNPARLGPAREGREEARARLGWPPGAFIVLHSGSIGLKQGLEGVVEAASIAAARGQGDAVRFVIQGDGSQRAALAAEAARRRLPNLELLPTAPEADLPAVLGAADALLVHQRASVQEMCLPSKLGTYLLAGRPVIGCVHEGDESAREIEASGAGLLVPPEEPAALLEAVARLRADPALGERLGRAGRAFAERVLAPDRCLGGFVEVIERCLAARGR